MTKKQKNKNLPKSSRGFSKSRFSRNKLIFFALIFVVIGGYFLYRSFAATSNITEWRVDAGGPKPRYITSASDGNLWFSMVSAERGSVDKIGRMTQGGMMTYHTPPLIRNSNTARIVATSGKLWLPSNPLEIDIASGASESHTSSLGSLSGAGITTRYGNEVWTHDHDTIAKFSTSDNATTHYDVNSDEWVYHVAAGPDGNIWLAAGTKIIKFDPSSTTFMSYTTGLSSSQKAQYIAAGPDGNMWFTTVNYIGKITSNGSVTTYKGWDKNLEPSLPAGGATKGPDSLAAGPDGNMWVVRTWIEAGKYYGKLSKMTPSGVVTPYSIPSGAAPLGVTVGPDRNIWFTTDSTIGRLALPQTVSFKAKPSSVVSGSATESKLTWNTTNATSCKASGSWGGNKANRGSAMTGMLTGTKKTYALTCTGIGSTTKKTITITVYPPKPKGVKISLVDHHPRLAWRGAKASSKVAAYKIYRNGVAIKQVKTPKKYYIDTSAKRFETYKYTIKAVNSAGDRSASSAAVSVNTR